MCHIYTFSVIDIGTDLARGSFGHTSVNLPPLKTVRPEAYVVSSATLKSHLIAQLINTRRLATWRLPAPPIHA